MKSLHIHAQQQEESRITGTREALEALQKALNQLISSRKSEKEALVEMHYNNGQVYRLSIQMKPSLEDDKLPCESYKKWDGESV